MANLRKTLEMPNKTDGKIAKGESKKHHGPRSRSAVPVTQQIESRTMLLH